MYTNSYKQNDLKALPHNQLEARTLIKAASMLNRIKEDWQGRVKAELVPALEHNRKLWTILSSEMAEEDHPMDHNLRQNIVNLAFFIFKHTIKVMAMKTPTPKDIEVLITINMEIAKGLNEQIDPEEVLAEEENNVDSENGEGIQKETSENAQEENHENDESSNFDEEEVEEDAEENNYSSNFTI